VRVLFASTHGAGHFGPLIPFIDAAQRNGHEVLVTGPPTLDPRGYPFRVGASPPEDVLRALWDAMPQQPAAQAEVIVVGTIFAGLNVEAMLPPTQELIAEWKPDLVVREINEYASAIAAERAGVPHVRVGISQAITEEGGLAYATPALEDVQPGIVETIAATPYVTCFPAIFDPAPFPVRRYRDPAADTSPGPLPDWWPGDERPLVYMTFGSVAAVFPTAGAAYRAALATLGDLPVRVLLTVGRELDLGEVPPNVHVEQWVPQADVLAHAALVLCHGGSGTTLGALAAGRPLVVVPLFADQPFNAARAGIVGAGVVATVDRVGRAVERVLVDGSYALAAERVAAEMRLLPPVDDFLGDVL
jgi:UDP:flavonoid glycosyltransferase YjiC (YdhE family)